MKKEEKTEEEILLAAEELFLERPDRPACGMQ